MKLPISAIILTFNEEKNIRDCLESIKKLVDEIIVVDSFSTDGTIEILNEYGCMIVQHEFQNYSQQRNWAIQNIQLKHEWIFNIDADHRVTKELADELKQVFSTSINRNTKGFLISRRTVFMNKWIRYGGHYPTYHANCFRKGFGICEEKLYDQHFIVKGNLLKLQGDIIDVISDSLTNFISRHNRWATLEAIEQLTIINKDNLTIKPKLSGNEIEKRRFLRNHYNKYPLFIRSFLYFLYRYFFRLGFLDGIPGLIFHSLQGFWYRFLIDAKIFELKSIARKNNKSITAIIKEQYNIRI